MTAERSHPRRRRERAASMVEFALVAPIFLLILFGIVDFGLAFNDYNSLRQGVREGAREGVVAAFGTECTGTASQRLTCLTEQRIGQGAAAARVKIKLEGTYTAGEQLTVCAMYPVSSTTGMMQPFLNGRVLKTKITMRLESLDAADPITNTAEAALPGKDWTWC